MVKRIFSLIIATVVSSVSLLAQTNGILPFTGIKYFKGGIWGKQIEVTLNGTTWTSNRLPVNTEFEINLVQPWGLKQVGGKYFPGVKILMLDAKKDTLAFTPNVFKENENTGMNEYSLKSLSISLSFNEKVKPGDTCYQYITFFDLKGHSKLLLEFPVVITDPKEELQLSKSTYTASSTKGYNASACGGIELKKIEAYMDSGYYPKSLYHSIRSAEMLGITTDEVNQGKFQTWLYDENMKEIPQIKAAKHYAAKTFKDREEINILVQIALDPTTPKNKEYTVRYRWESKDGKKVLDIVNKF
ncbi:hypothetical protein LK994_06980 [Ferruginibacter lapsinanis]|uniref:hypothetical protein n=1 Tax=Ferruginibacter lapsinanis TaxID=563172 RepID=UPI001E296180|nr:hypothetical protein [Ferruginibacter lapsinanis]UEG51215.1 hypothetical protein LK994_06980 [Ferruginibacter lapsinanis]